MLQLSLLRHAKSSWDNQELSDHERQLTKRGTKAATRIGRYMADNNLTPELILYSDAVRARATLALVLASLNRTATEITITPELYLAAPDDILRVIRREAGETKRVLVIGHNPGLHALALSLPAAGNKDDLSALAMKYPTAALAHITFDLKTWADIRPASGTLKDYVTPRSLSA